ncbi:MAG: hypothetical protein M3322_10010 [Actinomycetota bacterium]|nr:hypothetical protein [Actinomycetota bacterium]
MAREPGLDRHEWESEMQALEPELEDSPADALPELADLVERMLLERGYDVADPVVREGEEREVVAEYLAAREISDRVERGEDVGPGDVGAAIRGLRSIYDFVIAELETP